MLPELRFLIEQFPINLPDGGRLSGRLYQSSSRRTGRQIVVMDGDAILFDSGECYDLGNARHALDRWLGNYVRERQESKNTGLASTAAKRRGRSKA